MLGKHHWGMWLVLGGLGIDLIDGLTTKAGAGGGALFGTGGPLAGINNAIPGNINLGELLAMVGATFLFAHHQKG